MNCGEVRDQLIEFYEENLGPLDAEQIRIHLRTCPGCREELSAIEKVIGGLKSHGLRDPGEAFWRDFPTRVGEALHQEEKPKGVPILARLREWIYFSTRWLSFPKPVGAAVSIATVIVIIAGFIFFKTGWFGRESRGWEEETVEGYFEGVGTGFYPLALGTLEGLTLYQLNEISQGLMASINGMRGSIEGTLRGDGFNGSNDVFALLEELDSEELDFIYQRLRTRYFKSSTSLPMRVG
jgi:hypothetical protein